MCLPREAGVCVSSHRRVSLGAECWLAGGAERDAVEAVDIAPHDSRRANDDARRMVEHHTGADEGEDPRFSA